MYIKIRDSLLLENTYGAYFDKNETTFPIYYYIINVPEQPNAQHSVSGDSFGKQFVERISAFRYMTEMLREKNQSHRVVVV